jgi:hypothetical protein
MDSSKRFKTSHSDGNQDEGGELMAPPLGAFFETPPFLFEPNMCSHLLSFCDFEELLALRFMNKALKDFADRECIDRALKALPLTYEFNQHEVTSIKSKTRMERRSPL